MTRGPFTVPRAPYEMEHGRLTVLLEEYAYIESVVTEQNSLLPSASTIEVTMKMKVPKGLPCNTDEETRTALFWQAQECLRIFDINGYKIYQGPRIEIEGDVAHSIAATAIATRYECTMEVTFKGPDWAARVKGKRP